MLIALIGQPQWVNPWCHVAGTSCCSTWTYRTNTFRVGRASYHLNLDTCITDLGWPDLTANEKGARNPEICQRNIEGLPITGGGFDYGHCFVHLLYHTICLRNTAEVKRTFCRPVSEGTAMSRNSVSSQPGIHHVRI